MKVWIDILTPKQALFFEPLIRDLQSKHDEVLVTSRKYREVELIIKMRGIRAKVIGAHGGKSLLGKLTSSADRTRELADLVSMEGIDAAVSFSSPEASRVAFGLGIPNMIVNDSPHAEAVSKLTVPLCSRLLTPWIIPNKEWTRYGIGVNSIAKYKALDPAAWLKRIDLSKQPKPNLKLNGGRKVITVRLEESFAAYLLENANSKPSQGFTLLRRLVEEFPECNIVALGRYHHQLDFLQEKFGKRLVVPEGMIDGVSLLLASNLFIGMGGTMTAEAALLGVPTISFFRGSYDVERYLISKGLVVKPHDIEGVVGNAKKLMSDEARRTSIKRQASKLLRWMEDPIAVIMKNLGTLQK